jgi:hypothetical protein
MINVARSSQSAAAALMIGDCSIEQVSSFKLFGVTVSTDLRWSSYIKEIDAEAASANTF